MKTQEPAQGGIRIFAIIWFGQLVSTLGSGLTGFALGVYIYQQTGSATQLSIALLAAVLPNVLFSPIAGALVDRWDRRWVLLLSDTGAAISTLLIWFLLSMGRLEVWHLYLANAVNSFFSAFQRPAYLAAPTLLLPKQHYGRAAGLIQLSSALSQVASPVMAGFLVITIHIDGILLVDFSTYLFAMFTLILIRIPKPETTMEGVAGKGSLWREVGYGYLYLKDRPGLLGMLILFAIVNFSLGFNSALYTPLILSFTTPDVLGTIISVGGIGMLIGSLIMSAWGGAKKKVNSLMGSMFFFGLFISLTGIRANPILIGASSFVFFILLPIASGSSQAIWQAKVAPDIQGRVFATRSMIATAMTPLAYILAGPLADHIFEPLLASNGALAGSIGKIIGVGAGRGIGLIFLIIGLSVSLATLVGYLNPRIRFVEDELPDFVDETPNPDHGISSE